MLPRRRPWSATARSVCSGIVFTVSGATSSTTYMVSSKAGSFVLVDAHSGRCVRAPADRRASHRGVANFFSYSS